MNRFCDFGGIRIWRWPDPEQLKRYFIPTPGNEWLEDRYNDTAILSEQGAYGTEHLPSGKGMVNISLKLWGKAELGVLLIYSRLGGGYAEMFSSKGDMSRIREWVRTTHYDLMPVGLYIPFGPAYEATKEFIETNGELPKCIEWIANRDLPPNTFPDP